VYAVSRSRLAPLLQEEIEAAMRDASHRNRQPRRNARIAQLPRASAPW